MKTITLLYHDVVKRRSYESSGFPGGAANRYKIDYDEFRSHMQAISSVGSVPVRMTELHVRPAHEIQLLLTFDDGGASSLAIADLLEEHGWRGHFFISTDYIGDPRFLSPSDIQHLHARGHIIGSHSCSHPRRMSACSAERLASEWSESIRVLSSLVDDAITVASVPGGYHSHRVACAAAEAGIQYLFTSEPRIHSEIVDGCCVLGRYSVSSSTNVGTVARLAAGHALARWRQTVAWNLKKIAKIAAGNSYDWVREWLLN